MKRPAWFVAGFVALFLALVAPPVALAEGGPSSEVTMRVEGGELVYSLSSGHMQALQFDYRNTGMATTEGTVTLVVSDARGTREGWTIEIEGTAFAYTGDAAGDHDIAATHATITPGTPLAIAGQGLDGIHAGGSGTLEARRVVISADPGAGSGRYSQPLTINLDIPPLSPAGTYTTLLTVSASAAPGAPAIETDTP